mgnify:CR=1 FL=1
MKKGNGSPCVFCAGYPPQAETNHEIIQENIIYGILLSFLNKLCYNQNKYENLALNEKI